jgi:hypothetical protein
MVVNGTSVGESEGSVVGNGDWASNTGNWLNVVSNWEGSTDGDWSDGGLNDSWGRSVNNGVESLDGVSGVGDGTDGTIGLNEGVLSLNDISVAGLVGRVLVTSQGIGHGVSVVVLWMRVVWLSTDGWDNGLGGVGNRGNSLGDEWSVGVGSNWSHSLGNQGGVVVGRGSICVGSVGWGSIGVGSVGRGSVADWSNDSGTGASCKGEDGDDLDHCDVFWVRT